MPSFSLTKWYLDCVDADGRVAIAYWSAIAWRGIEVTWHSLSLHDTAAEPSHRSSLSFADAPAVSPTGINWQSQPLGCRFECHPTQPGAAQPLIETAEGSLDWRCEATAGEMVMTSEGHPPWHGFGYVERIAMTMAPWRLPIDQLRWGRWIAGDGSRSVAWIDWVGRHPLTSIFVDGQKQPAGTVGDDSIAAGDQVLTLADRQTLYSRSLSDTLGALRPVLAPLLPPSWMSLEDCKWRSRGTLRVPGRPEQTGWVIHEAVRWPS